MSWWIQKRDKDGSQHIWAIDVEPTSIIMVVAILFSFLLPTIMNHPLTAISMVCTATIVTGLVYLVMAKVPLYRQGIWNSWGTRLMSRKSARLYKLGYLLMFVGASLLMVFCHTINKR